MKTCVVLSCSHQWRTARGGGRCNHWGSPSAYLILRTSSALSVDSCSLSPPWLSQNGCLVLTSPTRSEPWRCPPCSKWPNIEPMCYQRSWHHAHQTTYTWFQVIDEDANECTAIHVPKCENGGVVKISREAWTPHNFLYLEGKKRHTQNIAKVFFLYSVGLCFLC